ncbi:hypothetical protein Tco_0589309 [Tanacetum coccineum]
MSGSYSFINVIGGKEEKDGRSRRNMVEVAIDSQKKLTIGVISPYAAQVASIQEKLATEIVIPGGMLIPKLLTTTNLKDLHSPRVGKFKCLRASLSWNVYIDKSYWNLFDAIATENTGAGMKM